MSEQPEYERSYDYFAALAATLLAGDIQARVVDNTAAFSIEVRLIDGGRIYWTNVESHWTLSHLLPDGQVRAEQATLPWDIPVVDAAKMIAMYDSPSPAEYPRDTPVQNTPATGEDPVL